MKNGTTTIAVGMLGLIPVLLVGLACIGWVLNIVKIVWALGSDEVTTMFVARVIGAFILPIGAVLGFF